MLSVAAQTNKPTSAIGSWQPPENFVDPVTLKVHEFKSQGLSEKQITAELEKLGMGWYPKTGAKMDGQIANSPREAKMPVREPAKAPSEQKATNDEKGILQLTGRTSAMRTSAASWRGVASEVVSGSMNVAAGQTEYHYLCVQLGNLDTASNWVETVLTHNLDEAYKWNTYDNDEGGGHTILIKIHQLTSLIRTL